MFWYSLLLGAGIVVSSPWWGARMLTTRRYREGLRERLGRVPERVRAAVAGRRVVWLHAVSVGELLAAMRLVEDLEASLQAASARQTHSEDLLGNTTQAALQNEPWRVMISTTTRTGQALARERFGTERVFWFPLDFAWAVRSWMRVLRPRLVILMESELWPRLLSECAQRGIPVAVANARMSDRSFRRAQRVKRLWRRVLRGVSLFLAQGEETAARLRVLGVESADIQVPGNLKYDLRPRETEMTGLLRRLLDRHLVVVAGSLLPGEEVHLLQGWPAVLQRVPTAVLLMAPRHPERFGAVAKQAAAHFTLYRATTLRDQARSGGKLERLRPDAVVLLDTVGDLASVYGLADVAFVGGSLLPRGGHNPLEPARYGVPVVIGASFENFREIVTEMEQGRGIEVVQSAEELQKCLLHLLVNRVEADELGQRGLQIFARQTGATQKTVEALLPLVGYRKEDVNEVRQ